MAILFSLTFSFLLSVCLSAFAFLIHRKALTSGFCIWLRGAEDGGKVDICDEFLTRGHIYRCGRDLHNYSLFPQAISLCTSASASSCPHLRHAHSFCMLFKNAHTDTDCESIITFMEIKHLKDFFPSFYSLNSSSSSFCHTIPISFLHFILKSTHSSMDLSSFRIM